MRRVADFTIWINCRTKRSYNKRSRSSFQCFPLIADQNWFSHRINGNNHLLANPMTESDQSRIIEMAWEDRTPFEAIETLYGLREKNVIQLMRQMLKPASFRLWRARVAGRNTKHLKLRNPDISRGYCKTQYKHR